MTKTKLSDGLSIDRFIPPQLRGMFFKNPTATAKYALRGGLDPYGFPTNGLVAYIPLFALNNGGTNSIQSVDAYKHTGTITGALWGPQGRNFDGDDLINGGNNSVLRPTNVSAIVWAKATGASATGSIVTMPYDGDSWDAPFASYVIERSADKNIAMGMNDGTWRPLNSGVDFNIDNWDCCGLTYDGETLRSYVNGSAGATNTDPSGNITYGAPTPSLSIGVRNVGSLGNYWTGDIGEIWVYDRALSAAEMTDIFERTRWRYQ